MPKEVSNKKSEKNVKKNTPKKTLKQKTSNDMKKRRPNVKEEVRRYFKRIYDVTGVNPTKMVKGKDGKWQLKNEKIVRELLKKKFSHLDTSGVNKHNAAIFKEQFESPDKPLFERSLNPFGSAINRDVTNLINRFNEKHPFIIPREIKIAEKWNEDGTLTPGRTEYDYDDMNFDKYGGIQNNLRRYSVDMINDAFADTNDRDLEKLRLYIIDNIHKNNPKIDPNESEENIINKYKEHVIESINKVNPSVVNPNIGDYELYLIRRFNKNEFFNEENDIEKFKKAFIEGITNDKDPKSKGAAVDKFKSYIIERINNDDGLKELEKNNDYNEYIYQVYHNIILSDGDYAENLRRKAEVFKEYLIDSVKNDKFAVDDDPVENYREQSEYGIDRIVSTALNDKFRDDLHMLESYIEDKEYSDKTLNNITDKLSDILNILPWKQINGVIVDKSLRKDYHEIYPKIENYLHRGLSKYGRGNDKGDEISDIYDDYIYNIDEIANAYENTDDKDIGNITTTIKSIDAKGGLIDKIVKEATEAFENDYQTTRGTERKNIDTNMISNIIANGLDGVIDQVRNKTIRDVAAKILVNIKGEAESHGVNNLSSKAIKLISPNIADRMYHTDEFRNLFILAPSNELYNKTLSDAVSKNIDFLQRLSEDNHPENEEDEEDEPLLEGMIQQTLRRHRKRRDRSYEMLPPEEKANKMLKEAADKHQDVIENVMMDGKEKSESNEEYEHQDEEHQDDEKQLEVSESSESSTIESVNEKEEELPEEEEHQEDENIHNEMSTFGVPTSLENVKESVQPQRANFVGELEQRQTETPQSLEVSGNATDDDLNDGWSSDTNVDNPVVSQSPVGPPQSQLGAASLGVNSQPHDRNDLSTFELALNTISSRLIPAFQYAQSSTDTNNILGGIVSIFKELPNGMDDEIANRLSEAVGPDGKKLFESKEEAARFIAKMRALNGNRLSSIKGGGQKNAIQLNITNQVISNMPRKPFIVDTHPIPYQY